MNTSENLDRLSDVLLNDPNIVSVREMDFLADLLSRAKNHSHGPGIDVSRTITRLAGEVVAQRACGLVGDTIVRRLTERPNPYTSNPLPHGDMGGAPKPPSPIPPSPGPRMSMLPPKPPSPIPPSPGPEMSMSMFPPKPPSPIPPSPGPEMSMLPPRPPSPIPPSPGPGPGYSMESQGNVSATAVLERPEVLPPRCVVLEEFLAPAELEDLLAYALSHEGEFKTSEVISPGPRGSMVDFEYRRSRVLMEIGHHYEVLVNRIRAVLPRVLCKLELEPFAVTNIEAQITASNDGDFFRWHSDNAQEEVATRRVTFVYFFHREPKVFQGGELRLYDSLWEGGGYMPTGNYFNVVPRQNQVVLFDSSVAHEITYVDCPSRRFVDSRFTANGWIRS